MLLWTICINIAAICIDIVYVRIRSWCDRDICGQMRDVDDTRTLIQLALRALAALWSFPITTAVSSKQTRELKTFVLQDCYLTFTFDLVCRLHIRIPLPSGRNRKWSSTYHTESLLVALVDDWEAIKKNHQVRISYITLRRKVASYLTLGDHHSPRHPVKVKARAACTEHYEGDVRGLKPSSLLQHSWIARLNLFGVSDSHI